MARAPHSLRGRLTALLAVALMLVWLAVAVTVWFDVRHELDELLDGHLAQAAALLVAQQGIATPDDDVGEGVDAPTLHRYAPKVAFQVFHEGRLALRSANAPAEPMVPPETRFEQGLATVSIDGTDWRVFTAQGAERDVRVFVGERTASRAEIMRAVLRSTAWPMLLGLAVLWLVAAWAVSSSVAPLRRLGRTLAQREPSALGPVGDEDLPAEMQPMVESLNGLFARIERLMAQERRFTADAAHELRTPVAAIRAQAQVALAEPDEARRRHALRATLDGCDRATRLVEQMLTLSRLEAQSPLAPEGGGAAASVGPSVDPRWGPRVDLVAMARRVVADLAPAALAKSQTVSLDAAALCAWHGDETLIAVLLRNLVDNAVRYSPRGARIEVALQLGADGSAVLSVDDSGPGMSPADADRLGQRFFRVRSGGAGVGREPLTAQPDAPANDPANDPADATPPGPIDAESGSGLGWSIVQRIATVHGLRVQVGPSATLGGLRVEVAGRAA